MDALAFRASGGWAEFIANLRTLASFMRGAGGVTWKAALAAARSLLNDAIDAVLSEAGDDGPVTRFGGAGSGGNVTYNKNDHAQLADLLDKAAADMEGHNKVHRSAMGFKLPSWLLPLIMQILTGVLSGNVPAPANAAGSPSGTDPVSPPQPVAPPAAAPAEVPPVRPADRPAPQTPQPAGQPVKSPGK